MKGSYAVVSIHTCLLVILVKNSKYYSSLFDDVVFSKGG